MLKRRQQRRRTGELRGDGPDRQRAFGHHDEGYRLGKMACGLIERRGLKHLEGGRDLLLLRGPDSMEAAA